MSFQTLNMTSALRDYLQMHSVKETPVLRSLRSETTRLPMGIMQISPEQGQFMTMLMELIGAKNTLEVGTFTGYSALVTALALPPDGKVITCDLSPTWTEIGKKFWAEAGVLDKIDLRIGPALDTLDTLIKEGKSSLFDFAFIDADKANYDAYYERSLELVRPNGLIAIDNVLWNGKVIDADANEKETLAIRALNQKIYNDKRVSACIIPIGDGLTLARKR